VPAAVLDRLKMKFITLLGCAALPFEAGQQRRCRWWFYHNA
jgi:hypothetical protein